MSNNKHKYITPSNTKTIKTEGKTSEGPKQRTRPYRQNQTIHGNDDSVLIECVAIHSISVSDIDNHNQGDGKHKYIPKRLRRNKKRACRIYSKVKWKMMINWLVITTSMIRNMGGIRAKYQYNVDPQDICCFVATTKSQKKKPSRQIFDGDTFNLVIDSGCF